MGRKGPPEKHKSARARLEVGSGLDLAPRPWRRCSAMVDAALAVCNAGMGGPRGQGGQDRRGKGSYCGGLPGVGARLSSSSS